MNIPSIIKTVYPNGPGPQVRFVKPSPDNGMVTQGSAEHNAFGTPQATARRQIFMKTGDVTPVHISTVEKIYFYGGGAIFIIIWDDKGKEKVHPFSIPGSTFVIPAGIPHAIICSRGPDVEGTPILTLFNSSPAATTTWEDAADELIQNRHLIPPPPAEDPSATVH